MDGMTQGVEDAINKATSHALAIGDGLERARRLRSVLQTCDRQTRMVREHFGGTVEQLIDGGMSTRDLASELDLGDTLAELLAARGRNRDGSLR